MLYVYVQKSKGGGGKSKPQKDERYYQTVVGGWVEKGIGERKGKHQKPTATERKMRIVKLPAERRKTCWSPTSAAGPPVVLLLLLMALLLLLTRPVCVDDVNNNINNKNHKICHF